MFVNSLASKLFWTRVLQTPTKIGEIGNEIFLISILACGTVTCCCCSVTLAQLCSGSFLITRHCKIEKKNAGVGQVSISGYFWQIVYKKRDNFRQGALLHRDVDQ